jgi:small conductance mechanosensitive channel
MVDDIGLLSERMERFIRDVVDYLGGYYEELVRLLPRLALAILLFISLYLFGDWLRRITGRRLSSRMRDPLLALFLARLAKAIVVVFAVVFMLRIIGLGGIATGIMAGAGIGAFIIGFAFKDIGENFLAGTLLAFKRPFRIGDVVEVNGEKGRVVSLNLRDTQIKTGDGRDVFVPNANIMKNPIMNFTLDGFLRHEFMVRLASGADLRAVRELVREEVVREPGLLTGERPPGVDIAEVGPGWVDLRITYWLDHEDRSVDVGGIRTAVVDRVLRLLLEKRLLLMPPPPPGAPPARPT